MIHHTEGSNLKVPIHLGLLIFNNLFFQVNRVRISFPILFHISYIIICTYYSFHHEQSLPTNLKKISTFCNLKKNKKKKSTTGRLLLLLLNDLYTSLPCQVSATKFASTPEFINNDFLISARFKVLFQSNHMGITFYKFSRVHKRSNLQT